MLLHTGDSNWTIYRRDSHFELLVNALQERHGSRTIEAPPPVKAKALRDEAYVVQRRYAMACLLSFITSHPTLAADPTVRAFVTKCDSPPPLGDPVILEGFLYKLDHRGKQWGRRWFVLRPTSLTYYRSHKDSSSSSTPLADRFVTLGGANPQEHPDFTDCFTLKSIKKKERAYILCPESEKEATDWMRAIAANISANGTIISPSSVAHSATTGSSSTPARKTSASETTAMLDALASGSPTARAGVLDRYHSNSPGNSPMNPHESPGPDEDESVAAWKQRVLAEAVAAAASTPVGKGSKSSASTPAAATPTTSTAQQQNLAASGKSPSASSSKGWFSSFKSSSPAIRPDSPANLAAMEKSAPSLIHSNAKARIQARGPRGRRPPTNITMTTQERPSSFVAMAVGNFDPFNDPELASSGSSSAQSNGSGQSDSPGSIQSPKSDDGNLSTDSESVLDITPDTLNSPHATRRSPLPPDHPPPRRRAHSTGPPTRAGIGASRRDIAIAKTTLRKVAGTVPNLPPTGRASSAAEFLKLREARSPRKTIKLANPRSD